MTCLKIMGLGLLLATIAACQPPGGRYDTASTSRLDGPVHFSSPVRQMKPECNDPRQILGKKMTDCLDPAYLKLSRNPLSVEQVRDYYSGNTIRSYGAAHGTQVEYASADGSTYLWYPGNSTIVKGEWRVVSKASALRVPAELVPRMASLSNQAFICFRYGANTYNPVTGRRGSVWECQDATIAIRSKDKEKAAGDIFNLSGGQLPYVMPKGNLTFKELRKKL